MTNRIIFFAICLISFSQFAIGQKSEPDTVEITNKSYKLIRLKSGLMLGAGFAKYYYGTKTESWIGSPAGPDFSFQLFLGKHNFGGRFKPATVNPEGNLVFGNDTLTNLAKLNVINGEWFYGYDLEPIKHFFVQPYISYFTTSYIVINEDDLGIKYDIPNVHGFGYGVELKKYFRVAPFQYIVPYVSFNGALIDYKKVNSQLDENIFSWEIGIKYSGWFTKKEIIN